MGLGSMLIRAVISGAIQAARVVAREEARRDRGNQSSKQVDEVTSLKTKSLAFPPIAISHRKALRVIGIVDGLLEQTRDEWLTTFRDSFGENSPPSTKVQENVNKNINDLYVQLKSKGFPCDQDVAFWTVVSDIHLELMLHKAFPQAWEEWNEESDGLLERAAAEAKRIAGERRMETLAKLMPDGRPPTDPGVLNERLMRATGELFAQVILPTLVGAGLVLENNPIFSARFGSLAPKVLISDMIEFTREMSHSDSKV